MEEFMRIFAVYTGKGGSGKTTTTVHLAVAAKMAGESVAIFDADHHQRSAEAWSAARSERNEYLPVVASVTPASIDEALAAARHDGITFCLIDAPPLTTADARRLLREAEAIIIPVRPSAFDLNALPRTLEIINALGKPFAVVLNACPIRAPEIQEARNELARMSVPVIATLHERRAFSRAVSTGRAVMEFEPAGRAAEEINALWRSLA
jgi:chromosome partitioning protein